MMRPTKDNFRRQVSSLLSAKRTADHYGLERELLHPCGYGTAAPFALDDEQLALLDSECHWNQNRRNSGESPDPAIPAIRPGGSCVWTSGVKS